MNYNDMLEYVKEMLYSSGRVYSRNPKHHFRNRFDHTRRVLGWAKRIEGDLECDKEVLYTACIFHDVGYSICPEAHAEHSEILFREYAKTQDFEEGFIENVAIAIRIHSQKKRLGDSDISNEATLLMEADLLDEEGALGFVWDFMAIAQDDGVDYYDSLDAIHHSMHILDQDYMVTPKAKEYWEEKKELVRVFCDALRKDLFEGEE